MVNECNNTVYAVLESIFFAALEGVTGEQIPYIPCAEPPPSPMPVRELSTYNFSFDFPERSNDPQKTMAPSGIMVSRSIGFSTCKEIYSVAPGRKHIYDPDYNPDADVDGRWINTYYVSHDKACTYDPSIDCCEPHTENLNRWEITKAQYDGLFGLWNGMKWAVGAELSIHNFLIRGITPPSKTSSLRQG